MEGKIEKVIENVKQSLVSFPTNKICSNIALLEIAYHGLLISEYVIFSFHGRFIVQWCTIR